MSRGDGELSRALHAGARGQEGVEARCPFSRLPSSPGRRVHVCVRVHMCVHACMGVCVHVQVHVLVYMCICVCMYACAYVCVCVHVCMGLRMYICANVCVHVCMGIYVHVYMCIYMCVHVCVCVHVRARTHTRVHACVRQCARAHARGRPRNAGLGPLFPAGPRSGAGPARLLPVPFPESLAAALGGGAGPARDTCGPRERPRRAPVAGRHFRLRPGQARALPAGSPDPSRHP